MKNYCVSMAEFPRLVPENEDGPRWKRAMESLPEGGMIIAEVAEYIVSTTITLKPNITILGQGNGRFHLGTTFKYTGTGAAFNFSKVTAGIKLSNFKITTDNNDLNYQKFVGIEVNSAELVTIQDITITNARIGIDCTASLRYIYLLKIENVFIWDCLNEGIYIRNTGQWKNGIYIAVGEISDNGIGIRASKGQGNTIEGKASEMGRNRIGAILLEGGIWTIKGSLWIENSPYGVQITGGNHHILGDIYCVSPINILGGSVSVDTQSHVQPLQKTMIKKGLVFWFSFEEGEGLATYDRKGAAKGVFSSMPLWNSDTSVFGTTVELKNGQLSIPIDKLDWTNDWTVMILAKGPNTSNLLHIKSSDNLKNLIFRVYPDGIQLTVNNVFKKNFRSYPNGDATINMNWHIVSYNRKTNKLNCYSQSGQIRDSYDIVIDQILSNPSYINIASNGAVLDDFILYNRLLSDSEIRAITQMKIPPDVKDEDYILMKSPNGSYWKQTIDDNGKASWKKM